MTNDLYILQHKNEKMLLLLISITLFVTAQSSQKVPPQQCVALRFTFKFCYNYFFFFCFKKNNGQTISKASQMENKE
jgi:hypothetical protein